MRFTKFLIILIALSINLLPFYALALGLVPCGGGGGEPPCTLGCFFLMIEWIIDVLLWEVSIPLAVTGFLAAGIYMLFGSSEQNVARGKAILKYTVIGIVLAWAAFLIIDTILKELMRNPNTLETTFSC